MSPILAKARVWWLAALVGAPSSALAADEDVLVEIHFMPVADAQIAIWLTRPDGTFVQEVFVTQKTGTLGIGNRPGRRDFLSSWRFPYGPRDGVLPIWAHARGKSYPKLVFNDDDLADQNSLGWHEDSSSTEPYYCRPLTADEHEAIAFDSMTCPSPAVFQSDKGRFSLDGAQSPYPPRNDLMEFEDIQDSDEAHDLAALNDLDAISGATPVGDDDELETVVIARDLADGGPLIAWIEVNIEHDENYDWEFERDADHYVDPRLTAYGIEYLGQPSVVYKVEFDPMTAGFAGTDVYAGYGDLDGATGSVHPPDATISESNGSGADRLLLHEKNGEVFRLGVYSHGPDSGGTDPNGGGWGSCVLQELPALEDVDVEAVDFDRVRVHFTVPQMDSTVDVETVRLYHRVGSMPLDETNASSAIQSIPQPDDCGDDIAPGVTTWCEIDQLFGSFEYQIGARLEDECNNRSAIAAAVIKTPAQEFATVEGACFVATAAWGAPWADRVRALRWFRDAYMRQYAVGAALVDFYYAYSPGMAAAIAERPAMRAAARAVLAPVADAARLMVGQQR